MDDRRWTIAPRPPPSSDRSWPGTIGERPIEMAHVLLGALNTSGRVIATADNPHKARAEVQETIQRLLKGLGY